MSKTFLEAVRHRRSIYHIGSDMPISQEQVIEIIQEAATHTPSAFNSQSARMVVLFGKEHHKLWEITKEVLRPLVPANSFGATEGKLASFAAGAGTVLFFEEQATVESLQKQFPLYSDSFPHWSVQSSGMVQYVVWTALEAEGLGASLQHYNPLIDQKVQEQWGIPASWKLFAQMPFGSVLTPAGDKDFLPVSDRVKVFQ